MADVREVAAHMKLESPEMASASLECRNEALARIRRGLVEAKGAIFAANARDLASARERGVAAAVAGRLRFDEHKLADVCAGLDSLADLPDPVGRVLLRRELDEGLELTRVSCPIGVIGVIFEARPDALVQISSLCIKSGNCAILKGGSETARTNRAIFDVVLSSARAAGLPASCLFQVEAHSEIDELLGCFGLVDLLVPRGSNAFVRHIMDNTKIPVMGHADGICHVYVDAAADLQKAVRICVDAKAQYAAACNAAETLLVHRDVAAGFLPLLADAYRAAGVELRGTDEVRDIVGCAPATDDDWDREYLSLVISARLVGDVDEAIDHINRHGSHHTDAIVTEDDAIAERFMQLVDSAGVYQNASTRFADGFRYGFGAEGDWKTAILVRAAKVMGHGLSGGASLMEDYCYEMTPGKEKILGAHMLEICPSLTTARPRLEIHPLSIGGREDPVRLVFDADPGPAVVVAMSDMRERFRLTANAVTVVGPDEPLPRLPVARAVWEPAPDLATSAECWMLAGAAHHTVMDTATGLEAWADLAEIAGMELAVIDGGTTARAFAQTLRLNQVYHRLAQGA